MPSCEMCGHIGGELQKAIVEGVILLLCEKCVRFGEVVQLSIVPQDVIAQRLEYVRTHRFSSRSEFVSEQGIVLDYAVRVKRAREKLGKTQEEVAQALAERGSVLQRIESGHLEPSLKLARKLEQYFQICLIQNKKLDTSPEHTVSKALSSGGSLTIGDVITFKK